MRRDTKEVAVGRNDGLPGLGEEGDRHVGKKMKIVSLLMQNFYHLLTVPIEASCQTQAWVSDPHLSMFDNGKDEYKLAVSRFKRLTQYLNFWELYKLHKAASNPTYYARNTNHYLSISDSIDALTQLLQYQCGENYAEFLSTLALVLEREGGKMNSIYIQGPANCGKTWFVDCLAAYFLNVGHVKNIVRGQNFPFNDCPNRRILIWNEPNWCPSALDTIKMLTAGDPCPAAIKYEGDSVISKTPLIFTSNALLLQKNDPIWASRVYFCRWHPAPFLANYSKKPHPLAIYHILSKYIVTTFEIV